MKSTATTFLALALFVVGACSPAWGQIPQKLDYQVMLTDDSDQPLAGQLVEMVFIIYDAASSGSALWTETQNVTTNGIGVVSVILGAVNPIDIPFDNPRWLEVKVEGETLSPRRELVTSPYAARAAIAEDALKLGDVDAHEYALLDDLDGPATINDPDNPVVWSALTGVPPGFADGVDDAGAGDGHSLDASDGDPVDAVYVDGAGKVGIGTTSPQAELHVRNEIQVGSISTLGSLMVHGGSTGSGGIRLQGDGYDGGYLHLIGGNGLAFATLGHATGSGGGGKLWLSRNSSGTNGIWADADYGGTGSARMDLTSPTETISFNLAQTGDASVHLPNESVNAYETASEPGVGSIQSDSEIDLNQYSITSVGARTITAPASGYVVVMATVQLRIYNYDTGKDCVWLGLSETAGAWSGASQEYKVELPGGSLDGGWYYFTTTVHGVFQVSAGSHTFYLNAMEEDGGCFVRARQFTVMYFPTAYGTVDTTD